MCPARTQHFLTAKDGMQNGPALGLQSKEHLGISDFSRICLSLLSSQTMTLNLPEVSFHHRSDRWGPSCAEDLTSTLARTSWDLCSLWQRKETAVLLAVQWSQTDLHLRKMHATGGRVLRKWKTWSRIYASSRPPDLTSTSRRSGSCSRVATGSPDRTSR